MAQCLLGLGSNLGDREAMLLAALSAIAALPDVAVRKHSEWLATPPIGGPAGQDEFLNGAALIDTKIAPAILLAELQRIEHQLGRKPAERWAPRPIDIDVLLYNLEVIETPAITVPHPRMTFRRFVLAPAAQIAPRMLHPVVGWPIERLLLHLDHASDVVSVVSPSDTRRAALAKLLDAARAAKVVDPPALGTAAEHWPTEWTTWLALAPKQNDESPVAAPTALPYAATTFPKLTILLDGDPASPRPVQSKWSSLVHQPGRGPTLQLSTHDATHIHAEALAAVQSVWPT